MITCAWSSRRNFLMTSHSTTPPNFIFVFNLMYFHFLSVDQGFHLRRTKVHSTKWKTEKHFFYEIWTCCWSFHQTSTMKFGGVMIYLPNSSMLYTFNYIIQCQKNNFLSNLINQNWIRINAFFMPLYTYMNMKMI